MLYARAGLVAQGAAWLQAAPRSLPDPPKRAPSPGASSTISHLDAVASARAVRIYADWLRRLRILQRFPQPAWSIADKWIAKQLLGSGMSAPQVGAILHAGSPGFPRRHARPEDYLRRTLARAASELEATPFPWRAPNLRSY